MNKVKTIKYLRFITRTILLVVSIFWFVFALLSGSCEYGGSPKGIIMNSPNALPWLFLFLLVYISWKEELIGGSLILLMGLMTIMFFKTYQQLIVFLLVSLPLILLGGFLIICYYLDEKNNLK